MSNTAMFEYKCRRCGAIDASTGTHPKNADVALVQALLGNSMAMGGVPLSVTSVHSCEDGGVGVSDIIGYSIQEMK